MNFFNISRATQGLVVYLRDWNQRVILHRLWGDQRLSYKSWAVHTYRLEPLELGLWRELGVDVLELGLGEYIDGLSERMHAPLLSGELV